MALTTISTVTGTIQKYFDKKMMDRKQDEFLTPLANSNILEAATIPKNAGQYAEFRKFDQFSVETNGTDDSPKTYGENAEPSSPQVLAASIWQVAFEMLRAYVEIGNVADATDPTGLIRKAYQNFKVLVRRQLHQLTNDRCVKQIVGTVLNASVSPSPLPSPFKTIYAGGVNAFADLTAGSYFTMADFKRGRSLLRNKHGNLGKIYAIINEAVKDQLLEDAKFEDVVKRSEDKASKAFGDGIIIPYQGMSWVLQSDPYRANLPDAGGALTTRANTGAVFVAHLLTEGAMGYVDFGDPRYKRSVTPTFKVQDISKTGTGPSIGYSMAYQAIVMDQTRGLNIAGTSAYEDTIDDIV